MYEARAFSPIITAPLDRVIEVMQGPQKAATLARWDADRQLWVRANELNPRCLTLVIGWRTPRSRPVKRQQG